MRWCLKLNFYGEKIIVLSPLRRMKPTRHLSRRKSSKKKGSARARNPKKMRGGVTRKRLSQLTQQELLTALEKLPADVVKQIGKRHPLLISPFTNLTLCRAVRDYLAGGARKEDIVKKYGEINNWDVSKVTNMAYLFAGRNGSFNQPLNNWNVSKVTDMYGMFANAIVFNQPLNKWDVSKVTNMAEMFREAVSFNQPLNKWNVSKVTTMGGMFEDAESFNQPLNKWNVSNVAIMIGMFEGASSFNQPLNNWNVSNVRYMIGMFQNATSFNQPLNDWNVSNVPIVEMKRMFKHATSFNQPRHAPWYHEEYDWTDSDSESEWLEGYSNEDIRNQ